jgi:hypothetical protein
VFDPYDAGRHSRRTRQQRKAALRAGRHFGGHAGTACPTRSVVRRRPGCSKRGTRVSLRRPVSAAGTFRRSFLCPVDALRSLACGNHRKRKVVKPAGVDAVVLLVRVAEGTAGVGVTDSDGGRGGFATGMADWPGGHCRPACRLCPAVSLSRPGCGGVLPHRASLRSHQPGSPWKPRGSVRGPGPGSAQSSSCRVRRDCPWFPSSFTALRGCGLVPPPGGKSTGTGSPGARYLMRPPRWSRRRRAAARGSPRRRSGRPTAGRW